MKSRCQTKWTGSKYFMSTYSNAGESERKRSQKASTISKRKSYRTVTGEEKKIEKELTPVQAQELQLCLQQYPEVTQSKVRTNHNGETQNSDWRDSTHPSEAVSYTPHAYKEEIPKELQEMKEAGIVEPSDSEWSAPMVIARKKDGTIRICIDFRKLNQHTKFDACPMPRIDDLLDAIGKADFITSLDLAKGYWQVPMAEEYKTKTAFMSPIGLYHFTVMLPRHFNA